MAAAVSRDDELVVKSPSDKRSYRLLRLANGLCALLVHDPEIYADGGPAPKPGEDVDMEDGDDDDDDEDDDDEEYSDEEGDDDDDEEDDEDDDGSEPKRKKEKGGSEPVIKKVAMRFCSYRHLLSLLKLLLLVH
jgi:nardilysin